MLKIRKIKPNELMEDFAILWIIVSSGFFVLNYVYNLPCMMVLFGIALYYIITRKKISKSNGKKLILILLFVVIDEIITLAIYDYPFVSTTCIILIVRLFSLAIIMDNIEIRTFIQKYINIFTAICLISLACFIIIRFTSLRIPFARNYQDNFYGSFYFRVNEYTKSVATRNSGPYGEAGAFAVYIVFALVFQLFSTPVNMITKGWNAFKTLVLSITLLTTLSATGLICFLIIFIAYTIFEFKSINIFKNPMMFIIVISMIIGLYYAETTYGILGEKVVNQGGSYGVRIDDTLKGYQIAANHFWTGTGITNDYSSAWKGALLKNSRSNGMANFVASVGFPFFIYYITRIFKQAYVYLKRKLLPAIVFFCVIVICFNTQPIVLQTIGLSFLFVWKEKRTNYD